MVKRVKRIGCMKNGKLLSTCDKSFLPEVKIPAVDKHNITHWLGLITVGLVSIPFASLNHLNEITFISLVSTL